jgi:hypothetical protein
MERGWEIVEVTRTEDREREVAESVVATSRR